MKYDVIVIGGGAAGLFCAGQAGQRGRSVLLLEQNGRVGRKIAVSGGGRCNFTNLHCRPDCFLSSNSRFILSPLSRFSPQDFVQLVEIYKIPYYEKKLGQLFCTDRSHQIVDMLLSECRKGRVNVQVDCAIQDIQKPLSFRIQTNRGAFESESLVIATGGLSIPKIGASDFGYRIASQFGIAVTDLRPGLVPLLFDERERARWSGLQGVSFEAAVRCRKTEFQERVLFTHRGLSGPAILQISSYWKEGESLTVNLLPSLDARKLLDERKRDNILFSTWLSEYLPKRLAQAWCDNYIDNKPVKQYSPRELADIVGLLHHWPIAIKRTEGYSKAEVTVGGVDTRELSSKTMESKKVSGLYFIGEVADLTGHLGGHNFQWAWSSAYAAGMAV